LHVLREGADEVAMAWGRRLLTDVANRFGYPLEKRVVRAPDPVTGILRETEDCNLLMIGATGERLFEQRLFGSIPERVARESTKTVIMTKRYWGLKSLLSKVLAIGRVRNNP
jgi:nucleotide-binding universal stress UspA family protein